MPLLSHPARASVIAEMHMRRMSAIEAPARIVQLLRIVAPADREAEATHFDALPFAAKSRRSGERHGEAIGPDGVTLLWEKHSEATTLTAILPGAGDDSFAFANRDEAFWGWIEEAPGSVLRATRIAVVTDDAAAERVLEIGGFDPRELLSTRIAGGTRVWTDFQVRSDGYGRLLVAANGGEPADLGRAVQRFQELGNYRNLALLGLQLVQQKASELTTLEIELAAATLAMCDSGSAPALLDQLMELASQVTALSAASAFRLGATAAYADIAMQRLDALAEMPIPGFQSLADFTERRLVPAARTCRSFAARIEHLAERIERATAQLRTRIDLEIQQQN